MSGIWLINTSNLSFVLYPGSKTSVRQQDAIYVLSECLDASAEIETLPDLEKIRAARSIKIRQHSITLDEWNRSMAISFIERSDARIAGSVWTVTPENSLLGYQFEFLMDPTEGWQGRSRWFSANNETDPWVDDVSAASWTPIRQRD